MKQATLPIPEIGLIAATRGMAGAGIGLLIAGKLDDRKRKMIGWPLFLIGVASTIPFVFDIMRRSRADSERGAENAPESDSEFQPRDTLG